MEKYCELQKGEYIISTNKEKIDIAIIVGGYNSSNTSHLVELCEENLPSYFISGEEKIISSSQIINADWKTKEEKTSKDFLPNKSPAKILITSGASCPDALVENVIEKIISFYPSAKTVDEMMDTFS